jgi:hypothetical protein
MATMDLRPMTLGEVLDRTFSLYRRNFLLFVGIAALPHLLILLFRFGTLVLTKATGSAAKPDVSAGLLGGAILGALGGLVLMLFLYGVVEAATVWAVSELYLGREASIRNSYSMAKGKAFTVLGIMMLVGLATGVGILLLVIPGIYIACRLAVAVPASIVEDDSPVSSMNRSMELTKGSAGQVFVLLLIVLILTWVVSFLLQAPVFIFSGMAAVAKQQLSAGVTMYSYVAEFLTNVLISPVGTIAAALMYYNLRVQKEGFDIQHLFSTLGATPPQQSPGA